MLLLLLVLKLLAWVYCVAVGVGGLDADGPIEIELRKLIAAPFSVEEMGGLCAL